MRRVAAALLLTWLALPAQAGLFDDDEARQRIDKLRAEANELGSRLDGRIETLNRNQLEFANQAEALRTELAKLRGQIEVISYDLEAAQKRQKDFYVDLDNRLRKLEQAATEAKTETPKLDPAVEARAYETALEALKASKFADAAQGFAAFIKAYPQSAMLASAHYWSGYAAVQLRDHAKAAELFGKFAATWPEDERAAAALESQASSLEASKDLKGARAALETLAAKYPNSEPGKRAKLKLTKKK